MFRTSVMSGAVAVALLMGSTAVRAEGTAVVKDVLPTRAGAEPGKFLIGAGQDDNDKELTHGWGRRGWGGYGYRGYSYRSYYSRPVYYYSTPVYYATPVYYYPAPTYYYYGTSGSLGGDTAKSTEPRVSVERAERRMTLPASLLNGK